VPTAPLCVSSARLHDTAVVIQHVLFVKWGDIDPPLAWVVAHLALQATTVQLQGLLMFHSMLCVTKACPPQAGRPRAKCARLGRSATSLVNRLVSPVLQARAHVEATMQLRAIHVCLAHILL
jgi:hypothetical protein